MNKFKIEHWYENIYNVNEDERTTDIDLITYAVTLVEQVNRIFGTNIQISEQNEKRYRHYKGREDVRWGRIPRKMYVEKIFGERYIIMRLYDYRDVKGCRSSDGEHTREEVIEYARELARYINTNDILSVSYNELIVKNDMKHIINCYEIAEKYIEFYKPFVDVREGIKKFLNLTEGKFKYKFMNDRKRLFLKKNEKEIN